MAKKKDKDTPNFVLTLPMKVEPWQADILDKRYEYLRILYNYAQGKLLRQFHYFEQTNEYKEMMEDNKRYLEEKKKGGKTKVESPKERYFKDHTFTITGIVGWGNVPVKINFTKFGLRGFITKLGKMKTGTTTYGKLGIKSKTLQWLSDNIWSAWYNYLYNDGKKIHFKKKGGQNNISFLRNDENVITGLDKIDLHNHSIHYKLKNACASDSTGITFHFKTAKKPKKYEEEALNLGVDKIMAISFVRRFLNGKRKYYVQFTFEGLPYNKRRKLGVGQVGIDIGSSTVAVSSLHGLSIDELANKVEDIQQRIVPIQWKMDRSKRATNSQNYDDNGKIKKGAKKWIKSNRYIKLQNRLRELRRHQAAVRRIQHFEMANNMLSLGNVFVVENNPIKNWVARAKETKISEKTGKYVSKKRLGKSVANHAPAEFVTILANKVKFHSGKFTKVDVRNSASRYDFTDTDNPFKKHELNERHITLANGDTHQRDLLSAFNLQHLCYDDKEMKQYDREEMIKDYPIFCKLEKEELMKFINGEKKDKKASIDAQFFKKIWKK